MVVGKMTLSTERVVTFVWDGEDDVAFSCEGPMTNQPTPRELKEVNELFQAFVKQYNGEEIEISQQGKLTFTPYPGANN